MKEYSIKFTKQHLTLFNTFKQIRFIKKRGNYIEATTSKIDYNYSTLKERIQNYPSKISSHAIPTNNLFLARISRHTQEIHFSPINFIYHFNEKLQTKSQKPASNFMLKSLSKEELEHRKKNINYLLKKNENEDTVDLRYVFDEAIDFEFVELENNVKNIKDNSDEHAKLRRVILRVKIVNVNELEKVCKLDRDSIVDVVSEMCSKMNGRFVLKCKYYQKELRIIRKHVLEMFSENDSIKCYNTDKIENLLIDEICRRENNMFILKGYKENIELVTKKADIEKIISENGLISLERLTSLICMEEDEIKETIKDNSNIVILFNKTCVIRKDKNPKDLRNIVIDFLMKQEFLKRSEISQVYFNLTGEEPNIFSYNKVMREFCTNKGVNWVIKNGA